MALRALRRQLGRLGAKIAKPDDQKYTVIALSDGTELRWPCGLTLADFVIEERRRETSSPPFS